MTTTRRSFLYTAAAAATAQSLLRARDQRRGQQRAQQEVAEVIGADLHLEAVLGPVQRTGHDGGVVDQDVERLAGPPVGEGADRGQLR